MSIDRIFVIGLRGVYDVVLFIIGIAGFVVIGVRTFITSHDGIK